jgi:hypothetical protein
MRMLAAGLTTAMPRDVPNQSSPFFLFQATGWFGMVMDVLRMPLSDTAFSTSGDADADSSRHRAAHS